MHKDGAPIEVALSRGKMSVTFGPCCFCGRDIEDRGRSMSRDGRDHGRQMAGMDVPWILLSGEAD
jgi:hypothetical protein